MPTLTPEREAELRALPIRYWSCVYLNELFAEIDRLRAANLTLAADSCDTEAAIFAACARAGIVRAESPDHNEPVEDVVERMAAKLAACRAAREGMPRIVCLCGSTRFYAAFQEANYRETMAGKIVLSVGHYQHSLQEAHGESVGCTPEQKIALDVLHKQKIDLADEALVLNVGGYIGDSTRSEIEHATKTGKPVRYLEALASAPPPEAAP